MPSNDTENIYATQYGGEGEPIPATKISYDGAGTSIEATTVQAAITEIDTDLQSTKVDVNDIKTALQQNYVLVDYDWSVSETSDGTKTYGEMLQSLHSKFMTALGNLEDDEALQIVGIDTTTMSYMIFAGNPVFVTNETTSKNITGIRTDFKTSSVMHHTIKVRGDGSAMLKRCAFTETPTITFTDLTETVPESEAETITVYAYKYKRV